MDSLQNSTLATPMAIVGLGMATIGYFTRGYILLGASYALLVVGMMQELKEEAEGEAPARRNYLNIVGLAVIALIMLTGRGFLSYIGVLGFGAGAVALALGETHKKMVAPLKALSHVCLLLFFSVSGYVLYELRDTSLLFASNVILAVFFGITLGHTILSKTHSS